MYLIAPLLHKICSRSRLRQSRNSIFDFDRNQINQKQHLRDHQNHIVSYLMNRKQFCTYKKSKSKTYTCIFSSSNTLTPTLTSTIVSHCRPWTNSNRFEPDIFATTNFDTSKQKTPYANPKRFFITRASFRRGRGGNYPQFFRKD